MTEAEQIASAGTAVRCLSESEIQERLYGSYLGRRKKESAQPAPARAETQWTGSEILNGELQRLRSELISLRREKEQLSAQLEHVGRRLSSGKQGFGIGRRLARSLSLFLLLGAVGYLVGGRVLQASPAVGDATPYTVQVAVYNGRQMAEQAAGFLKELGYDAFLAEVPRSRGNSRYRVYVGSFVTKEEADRESKRLAGDSRFRDFKDAFVLVR